MIEQEILNIAEQIKKAVPAEKIYLFGSYARGTQSRDSDYDFFVVIPDGSMRPMEAMQAIYEELAKYNLFYEMHPKQIEICCYLCQQSAEKILKAFLEKNGCEIPRTHNLVMLCQQCVEIDSDFSSVMEFCTYLTPYAVQTRYPNEIEILEF